MFLSALPRLASASSPSRFCQPRAPLADMGRTAEEPASASADTLAWVARVEEKQVTLWTSTQELRVQLQGGAAVPHG